MSRLAYWFFFISIGAHWSCVRKDRMTFDMSWYSFIFPNTALITATFAVGKAFESRAIQIIGCVLTPILVLTWIFVFGMMIRAVILEQILWPQKGEDKDEIGFTGPKSGGRSMTMTDWQPGYFDRFQWNIYQCLKYFSFMTCFYL